MKKEQKCICYYARFGNSSQLKMKQKETELKHYDDIHNLEIEKIEIEHLSELKQSAILKQFIEDKNIKIIPPPMEKPLSKA